MLTPFDSEYAEKYIADILQMLDEEQFPDAVAYLIVLTVETYEDSICLDALGLQKCYELWTAACLLDAVFNHTDYVNDCRYYADKYIRVVNSIEEGFQKTKRKFFKKLPLYSKSKILTNVFDALLYLVTPDAEDLESEDEALMPHDEEGDILTQLGGMMQDSGKFSQWENDVMDLAFRLQEHIEDPDKTWGYYHYNGELT